MCRLNQAEAAVSRSASKPSQQSATATVVSLEPRAYGAALRTLTSRTQQEEAVLQKLCVIAQTRLQFRAQAIRLMGDAARGATSNGWREETQSLINQALGSRHLQAALAAIGE